MASSPRFRLQDVQDALQQGSPNLLSVALLQSHNCCSEHCVHEAVKLQHLGALDFLLERGAAEFDEPCWGRRPLHHAVEASMRCGDMGYVMAERLLERGARPDACTGDAQSRVDGPLHDAAKRGNVAITALLLAHGADVSRMDRSGQAALHVAVRHASAFCDSSHVEVAQLLLQHGASPLQLDDAGRKPFDYAFGGRIKDVLTSSEQQWIKRVLSLAFMAHSPPPESICMQMPEIFAAVSSFL